jgi:DNA-binding FrmR family transcriptional regulator
MALLTHRTINYTCGGYDEPVPGYTKDKQKIATRLRRIEGQVRGIQKMVDEDRYCIDVLTQVNATRAALESVALKLLADHTEHCVMEAIQSGGGSKKVRELNDAVERLVRS